MKLLVCIDFSDLTPWVLETARTLAAGKEDARICLLHVSVPELEVVNMEIPTEAIHELLEERQERERKRLDRHVRDLSDWGLKAEANLIYGPVVETILEIADKEDPDMILLGARAKSTVKDFVLGSVSRHVVQGARMPVVIVPPKMGR